MKKTSALILLLFICLMITAQVAPNKYWIRFTDKNNSPYSINNPEQFLSQKAIDRRNVQGIAVVENDLPVNQSYIQGVASTGATILTVSKWMNSVTVYTTDPDVIDAINLLPYVLSVSKSITQGTINLQSEKSFFKNESYSDLPKNNSVKGPSSGQSFDYGAAYNQINMLNGIALHDLGYDGTGMTIAILDGGFLHADTLSAFDSLWMNGQIFGFKDFVSP